MKARSLVSFFLLSTLVILLLSTAVQATEYREVKAEEISKQIQNGEDIDLTNCLIIGELNVSNINLETVPNPAFNKALKNTNTVIRYNKAVTIISSTSNKLRYNKEELISIGLNENSSVIESNITVKNSIFENGVNFSNVHFKNFISFKGTTFSDVNFKGASFSNPADFDMANFGDRANFMFVNFIHSASFDETNFDGDADFYMANFGNYANLSVSSTADLTSGDIQRSADFRAANFDSFGFFSGANFGDYAKFYNANFHGHADFVSANFGDCVGFSGATFGDYAIFGDANFTDTVEFDGPETSENIFTDWKTYGIFREYYKSEARYEDADTIYYNYRLFSQEGKSLLSFSKWMDILSWITCGYGLRPSRTLLIGGIIVGFFSTIYWKGSGIYRSSDAAEKKSIVSGLDALLFSVREFTTLGSADWYPRDKFRILVTLEGLLGWIMLGIFMATLTNVMIRS